MKGLVLSGGTGSRLRPITYTSAKQLVPIANKPILFYGLESLAMAGVEEIGIIVGQTKAEVMAAVGDGSEFGIRVTYIPQESPLGLAHCVSIAQDFLGDDDFVMYLGDNFILRGVQEFVEGFRERSPEVRAQILLAKVPDPHRFGVAILNPDGSVKGLIEKPKDLPSDLALVGVYLFDASIHEAVRAISPSARGELEITDAIDWLIASGHEVRSSVIDGYWKDLGEPEALLEGNRLALELIDNEVKGSVDGSSRVEGLVQIGENAKIEGSVIRGPAIIGAGTLVRNSFIGPYTSIGERCTIVDSEIEYSIVLAECKVLEITRIEGSILGKACLVSRRSSRPSASRMVVGDHSQIEVYVP